MKRNLIIIIMCTLVFTAIVPMLGRNRLTPVIRDYLELRSRYRTNLDIMYVVYDKKNDVYEFTCIFEEKTTKQTMKVTFKFTHPSEKERELIENNKYRIDAFIDYSRVTKETYATPRYIKTIFKRNYPDIIIFNTQKKENSRSKVVV